jgi:hypothetical protein
MMPPSPNQDPVAASAEQVRAQMALLAAAASPPSLPRRRLPRLPEAATAILKGIHFVRYRIFMNLKPNLQKQISSSQNHATQPPHRKTN